MRNKRAVFVVICCMWAFSSSIFSQQEPQKEEVAVSIIDSLAGEQRLKNDSLLRIARIDSTRIQERVFGSSISQKYANDDNLNYERSGGGKSILLKIKEWFQNLLRKLLGLNELTDINKVSRYVLNIVFAVILLVVIYLIVRLIMNHKGRWVFDKKEKTVEVNIENVEEHIHEADFETLIRETEKKGDTRQSIRLHYLWLLKTFTDKAIIEWNPEKTNADYTREINNETLKNEFKYLSYLYNYIWYGEFSINDAEYQQAKQAFIHHVKRNGK